MRRFSLVLIAVGAFLIVLAPMIRFYAYPRLAVAPANQRSVTTLVGPNATVFDIGTLKEITTDLTTKVNTSGDATTPDKCSGAVTYVNTTSTTSSDGVMRSRDVERMTFNARTGEGVPNCGNDYISDQEDVQTPVKHTGLPAKFPFQTEKKTYQFWDSTLRKSAPIDYLGTAKVDGVDTYKFGQNIEPTAYTTMDVPLSVLGLAGDDTVTADRVYSNNRTLWVEPETGVILKRSEGVRETLDYQGESRVTLTEVTTGYDDATVKKNADEYGSQASMLKTVRTLVPQAAFVLGLLALVGGIVLGRRRVSATAPTREKAHAHA
ncbi:DUF3068 domain-containing protein [Nocardioides marmoriginsengisoli]|uniref:DUF3068 domain-containing protein n=1 Tax=Nocardioides marmoriginsengisoli TaxID=661483 RepID=A0A3N0CPG3_9ACTN|nr:DUF3068 domain-containing protein [Nocardioides marmoriginsengisoli]RNL64926.1 DUF3068 domain-containing protein [Nocardioides marmoriginsengisoli]